MLDWFFGLIPHSWIHAVMRVALGASRTITRSDAGLREWIRLAWIVVAGYLRPERRAVKLDEGARELLATGGYGLQVCG